MSIKLYHGDCNSILKEVITDTTIIVTDPPFNIGIITTHIKIMCKRMRIIIC